MNLEGLGLQPHQVVILNGILSTMTHEEKDLLFDKLDEHLHEETYNQLDDEVSALITRLEDLGDTIDFYNEVHTEWMEGQKVAYSR